MLALLPENGEVLGCAMQEPFVRIAAPAAETRSTRRQRPERETDVWMRLVQCLGSFPLETTIVHVGDRGADMFDFFQACRATHTHFLVRGLQNRRVHEGGQRTHLLDEVRSWSSQDVHPLEVSASHGRCARSTQVQLAFGKLTMLPPRFEKRSSQEPLLVWAIRVWEEHTPEEEEPLEWLLLTSVPTLTLDHAWEGMSIAG